MAESKKRAGGKAPARLTTNEANKLVVMQHALIRRLSTMAGRASVASRMGKSYDGKRDLYEALGYPEDLKSDDYMARYLRQDIARAIVDAAPRESWRIPPLIKEEEAADGATPQKGETVGKEKTPIKGLQEDEGTELAPESTTDNAFDAAWDALVKSLRVYKHFARVDRLASIGEYAILLIGFDDGGVLEKEATSAREILYLQPYSDISAPITEYDKDPKSPRYGLPLLYNVSMQTSGGGGSSRVHWTRVIHVAEDLLEDNVKGMPRLQAVFNRLQDLEMISGGASEMFWRGGFPGLGLSLQPGAQMGTQDLDSLKEEMEDYLHGFQRYIRLRNVDVTQLSPQVADPTGHVTMLVDLISAATRIPKRILLGSERGELASSQDERNWAQYIDARRKDFCEQSIVRPFVDRLIEVGALPNPASGYALVWDDMLAATAKEVAEIGAVRTQSLTTYANSTGAPMFVPPEVFYEVFMGMTDEEIEKIASAAEDQMVEALTEQKIEAEAAAKKRAFAEKPPAGEKKIGVAPEENLEPVPKKKVATA